MIAFVSGTLAGRTADSVVVDVHGVGMSVLVSQLSLSKVGQVGDSVKLLTYLAVREDALTLYGFLSEQERTLFERLIGVSGVGPKVALSALSFYSPDQLSNAIAQGDTARVAKIPGIGKKTAGRIVLELKGSIQDDAGLFASDGDELPASSSESVAMSAAIEALLSMGFTDAETQLALKDAPQDSSEAALLQYALKKLGTQ